jgi:hypothetical protein
MLPHLRWISLQEPVRQRERLVSIVTLFTVYQRTPHPRIIARSSPFLFLTATIRPIEQYTNGFPMSA